ncbi:Site-specific recombinase XerD [Shimia gijangensis]|uniref:Site-specific recombinase XerD n=1 Tax=Shimia gijangensis TaxID=1470563 RepID=A0A1M6TN50_9RHOB|nr:tyrosine-type recombinase/integrase [Shimia gijangensis]SHK58381.1 Site-specific recombinase XerD [Shimia gijangensis]
MDIQTLINRIRSLPEARPLTALLEREIGIGADYKRAWYSSQKEHWLGWLGACETPAPYKRQASSATDARLVFQRLSCAPMLFWLADASEFEETRLRLAFDAVVAAPQNGARQSAAFRRIIPWELIDLHLNGAHVPSPKPVGEIDQNALPPPHEETVRYIARVETQGESRIQETESAPPRSLEHLEAQDWRAAFERLEGAYAPATLKSYLADVKIYVSWCAEKGIAPFPASVDALCRFLEDQAPGKAPSTVRRRLYAVRKVHRLLHLPDPTWDEDINVTIRRIRRAKLARPKQAKGLTRKYLDAFLSVQPDNPWGLRNRAMLSLGYELLTRRSELVALTTQDIEVRDDGTLRVLIRRSKADPFGQGRISFTSRETATLVQDWLDWRGPHITYLFCPIYHGKALERSVSTTTVKTLIKSSAKKAGLGPEDIDSFSGHSLRVGAAQDLLCAGYDTAAIMRAGGWKSVNILSRYLELAEHNVWE